MTSTVNRYSSPSTVHRPCTGESRGRPRSRPVDPDAKGPSGNKCAISGRRGACPARREERAYRGMQATSNEARRDASRPDDAVIPGRALSWTTGEQIVEMEIAGLENGLTKIVLTGRLDTPGVDRIEARFVASIVPASKSAIVDISGVEFIASMGIRMFIAVARSLALRKAKLALYGAQTLVSEIFENVSLKEIIPVVDSETEAVIAVEP